MVEHLFQVRGGSRSKWEKASVHQGTSCTAQPSTLEGWGASNGGFWFVLASLVQCWMFVLVWAQQFLWVRSADIGFGLWLSFEVDFGFGLCHFRFWTLGGWIVDFDLAQFMEKNFAVESSFS